MRMVCLPSAFMNALLASSTRMPTPAGTGETDSSVPVSIRATSSRSLISTRMRSACSTMMRWNWRISAGSSADPSSNMVVAQPLMAARGVLSSWLTMARNSARSLSRSSNGVMSWRVTTTESSSPLSSE